MKRSLRVVSLMSQVEEELDRFMAEGFTWNRTKQVLTGPDGCQIWYRAVQNLDDAHKLAGMEFSYITYLWDTRQTVPAVIPNFLSSLIREPA